MAFSVYSYSQESIKSLMSFPEKAQSIHQFRSLQDIVNEDSLDMIWYEDFENGFDGNNNSLDPQWTVGGNDSIIWEHDFDGSNGEWNAAQYTIESQSISNGWMIFDADSSNEIYPQSNYNQRTAYLTSPYIDLTNDTNVTLKFDHAFRYCCYYGHEMTVYINDGTGWNDENSFKLNDFVTVNQQSGTETAEIIISEIAGLKDSVQIRFDWGSKNPNFAATHYYWMIDDVRLTKTQPYAITFPKALKYFDGNRQPNTYYNGFSTYQIIPKDQQSGCYFGAAVNNTGYNTIDDLKVYAEIEAENYNGSSEELSISSTNSDSLYVSDPFISLDTGVFISNIYVSDDSGYINSDTLNRGLIISDFIYAKDNGNSSNSFGYSILNNDGDRKTGHVFDINQNITLSNIMLRLDDKTSPNAILNIEIHLYEEGSFVYLMESGDFTVNDNIEKWFNVSINPTNFVDGDAILVLLSSTYSLTDTVALSTNGRYEYTGEGYSIYPSGSASNPEITAGTFYYFPSGGSALCIRLNLDPEAIGVNVGINENNISNFNIFPNPNNGKFNVQIQAYNTEKLNLVVRNLIGQMVYQEKVSVINSKNKSLDLSYLPQGMYTVSLESEISKLNMKKIIIQ